MRGLVQRVTRASVRVGDDQVGACGPGVCVLVGVGHDDDETDAKKLASRIVHLRIFEDDAGKMNLSLLDKGGSMLAISQFTLMGDTLRGRRPSFNGAAAPERASELVGCFVREVVALGVPTETGRFGAHMTIDLQADGPVTLMMDTKERRSG